ncbi:MAG: stage II sporulation protein M [Methanothrix sp.]
MSLKLTMNLSLKDAMKIVTENHRPYLILNIVYFGLVLLGAIYSSLNPSIAPWLKEGTAQALTNGGPLVMVANAYISGNFFTAAVLTFIVNLILGAILYITLPSMVVPFFGLLMGAFRAVLWGVLVLSIIPYEAYSVPAWLTMFFEGEAYILVMLAAYIQGKAFLWPESVGAATRRQGYIRGLEATWKLYVLIVLILAVAAIWEAFAAIYLMPMLGSPTLSMRIQSMMG